MGRLYPLHQTVFLKLIYPNETHTRNMYTWKIVSYWYHGVYLRYTHTIRVKKERVNFIVFENCPNNLKAWIFFNSFYINLKVHTCFLTPALGVGWDYSHPTRLPKIYNVLYPEANLMRRNESQYTRAIGYGTGESTTFFWIVHIWVSVDICLQHGKFNISVLNSSFIL
jgi:hypothetical protein